jgi:hypothetical protein
MCKALFTNMLMVAAVSISPVVKSIFEAENGDGSYRRSSEAVQVFVCLCLFLTLKAWQRLLLHRRSGASVEFGNYTVT